MIKPTQIYTQMCKQAALLNALQETVFMGITCINETRATNTVE